MKGENLAWEPPESVAIFCSSEDRLDTHACTSFVDDLTALTACRATELPAQVLRTAEVIHIHASSHGFKIN
eukprot:3217411-Pyramimonas_sp.AAC.1